MSEKQAEQSKKQVRRKGKKGQVRYEWKMLENTLKHVEKTTYLASFCIIHTHAWIAIK